MRERHSFRTALFHRLVASVGLASTVATAACGDSQGSGTGGAGGEGSGSTTSGSGTTSATGTTSTTSTTTSTTTTSTTGTTTTSTTTTATGMKNVERCFPSGGATCPDTAAAPTAFGSCTATNELVQAWLSGPTVSGTDCCYQVDVSAPNDVQCVGIPGRPFVVAGRARVAKVTRGARGWDVPASARVAKVARGARGWDTPASAHPRRRGGKAALPEVGDLDAATRALPEVGDPDAATRALPEVGDPDAATRALPEVGDLDAATRALLGQQWAEDAAYEHASVASFGKLALELLSFGAPADLIRATHEAALDEIGHAAMAFALASRYLALDLGAPVGPGPLVEARSFEGAATLAELAGAAVREGCFGETAAAIVASIQHDGATDPAARQALAIIAAEEARHAELAFKVVAWAITAGGEEVHAAARHALASVLDEAERAAQAARGEAPASDTVRAHGRLSNGEALAARLAAGRDVVAPAMARLLGSSPPPPPHAGIAAIAATAS